MKPKITKKNNKNQKISSQSKFQHYFLFAKINKLSNFHGNTKTQCSLNDFEKEQSWRTSTLDLKTYYKSTLIMAV
jgi:hypothetical protein